MATFLRPEQVVLSWRHLSKLMRERPQNVFFRFVGIRLERQICQRFARRHMRNEVAIPVLSGFVRSAVRFDGPREPPLGRGPVEQVSSHADTEQTLPKLRNSKIGS